MGIALIGIRLVLVPVRLVLMRIRPVLIPAHFFIELPYLVFHLPGDPEKGYKKVENEPDQTISYDRSDYKTEHMVKVSQSGKTNC